MDCLDFLPPVVDIPTHVGNNRDMNNTQTPTTVIGLMAEAMTTYNTEQLIDIIRTIEAGAQTEDERIIKYAAHEVIENRHPEIGPILDSRIDEDLSYTDLVVDVLRNLGHLKAVNS